MVAIIENEIYFASKLWEDSELYMVSPQPKWPEKICASKLKFESHFSKSKLPETGLRAFVDFISSIPTPAMEERVLHVTWLETLLDITKSKTYVLGEGKCFIAQILYPC